MRLTYELLCEHNACIPQRDEFRRLYPSGCEPTVDELTELASHGLDVWWLWRLLPDEGIGSKREYAWLVAEMVAHLATDPRSVACRALVRRMVEEPGSVSEEERRSAYAAAYATYAAAAGRAAAAYAYAAADAATDAAYAAAAAYAADAVYAAAALACLSQLLCEAE